MVHSTTQAVLEGAGAEGTGPTPTTAAGGIPQAPVPAPHIGRPTERFAAVLAVVVLVTFAIALVISASGRASTDFGDSHDGRNAGVWASGSRSLRQEGPVAARLGTRTVIGNEVTTYANHPPLIALETAVAEALLGEHPWVTRLPAWGGTLAALMLAWFLLRACGLQPLAASIGVAIGFGCPMIAVYGTMLDTPVVGFPFGIAVLLLWQRARIGRHAPTPVVVAVTALAVLSSWLGVLTACLVTAAVLVPRLRRRSGAVPATGFLIGALGGGVAVTAWITWTYGSLRPLLNQFVFRTGTGAEPIGLSDLISSQRYFWPYVLTPWLLLLLIPAVVAAVHRADTRAVGGVALAVVGLWVVGFRDGAVHHDYWAYWIVLPLTLGLGAMADVALNSLLGKDRFVTPSLIAISASVVGLSVFGAAATAPVGAAVERGAEAGALLRTANYPAGQRMAWYLGDIIAPVSWVSYGAGRPAAELRTRAAVDQLAATAPEDLVLVNATRLRVDVRGSRDAPGCRTGVEAGRAFALMPVALLADNLTSSGGGCE